MEMDNLILRLDNPRAAEQFRIRKLVEDQFNKIDEEIKQELVNERGKTSKTLKKSTKKRSSKAVKIAPLSLPQSLPHFQTPPIQPVNELQGDHAFPKMEIIRSPASKFESLSTPKLMVKPENANVALYSYQHKEVVRPQVLSCHLLPGVNIRPALVIESIPGLIIDHDGVQPQSKVHVEYVKRTETRQAAASNLTEEPISITDSTTSKFEEVERLVEKDSTEEQIKHRLREKVKCILMRKYGLDVVDEDGLSNENQQVPPDDKIESVEAPESSSATNSSSQENRKQCVQESKDHCSLPNVSGGPVHAGNFDEQENDCSDTKYSSSFEEESSLNPRSECVTEENDNEGTVDLIPARLHEFIPRKTGSDDLPDMITNSSCEPAEKHWQLSTILEVSTVCEVSSIQQSLTKTDVSHLNQDEYLSDSTRTEESLNNSGEEYDDKDETIAPTWNERSEATSVEPVSKELQSQIGERDENCVASSVFDTQAMEAEQSGIDLAYSHSKSQKSSQYNVADNAESDRPSVVNIDFESDHANDHFDMCRDIIINTVISAIFKDEPCVTVDEEESAENLLNVSTGALSSEEELNCPRGLLHEDQGQDDDNEICKIIENRGMDFVKRVHADHEDHSNGVREDLNKEVESRGVEVEQPKERGCLQSPEQQPSINIWTGTEIGDDRESRLSIVEQIEPFHAVQPSSGLDSFSMTELGSMDPHLSLGEVVAQSTTINKSEGEVTHQQISETQSDINSSQASTAHLPPQVTQEDSVASIVSPRYSDCSIDSEPSGRSSLTLSSQAPTLEREQLISSLSEGEWRASPKQLQRLVNMASSFRIV